MRCAGPFIVNFLEKVFRIYPSAAVQQTYIFINPLDAKDI